MLQSWSRVGGRRSGVEAEGVEWRWKGQSGGGRGWRQSEVGREGGGHTMTSNSGGLATLCLLLCTLAHSGNSSRSITSYHPLPAPGWPLPALGPSLVILQRCPQLLQLTSS